MIYVLYRYLLDRKLHLILKTENKFDNAIILIQFYTFLKINTYYTKKNNLKIIFGEKQDYKTDIVDTIGYIKFYLLVCIG